MVRALRCAPILLSGCPSKPATPTSSQGAFWSCKHTWWRAATNTTRCLVGCSVGDLSALYLLSAYSPALGVASTVAISCTSGIATSMALETLVLRLTEGLAWRVAWRPAAGMSLLSMVAMELAENAVEVYLTGGAPAAMCGSTFWAAIPPALLAGFVTPLPYVRAPPSREPRGLARIPSAVACSHYVCVSALRVPRTTTCCANTADRAIDLYNLVL